MTTKKKFEVEDPDVRVLSNGRFAFTSECPWQGKNGKTLTAFKFCSTQDYERFKSKQNASTSESEHIEGAESEQTEAPEEP